jgi:hypothetical protein
MSKNFLKSKRNATITALAATVAGFIFLNKGITGNAIFEGAYTGNVVSVIGLLLIGCAAVLAGYAIKK